MMPEIALLVARAPTLAERLLLVALDGVTPRPRLRSQLEVDGRRIDVAVELGGRRLAVILGRTGEHRTAADVARDEALERAGWPVYRLPPDRVTTRPQRAVGDVLAALHERGAPVPRRVPAARREASPAPLAALRKLCGQLGRTP